MIVEKYTTRIQDADYLTTGLVRERFTITIFIYMDGAAATERN
jgi:hypothetical protein